MGHWVSHITHEWVMSHISRWTSQVAQEGVTSCRNTPLASFVGICSSRLLRSKYSTTRPPPRRLKHPTRDPPGGGSLWSTLMCHVMWYMSKSCHMGMSHVTHECVMWHMNESRHMYIRHVTLEWVISHINESRHTWMSHHISECVMLPGMSRVTYEPVKSHMNDPCHMNESCYMNESCHTWMSHVTHEWVMYHTGCLLW